MLQDAMEESFHEFTGARAKLGWTINPAPPHDRFCALMPPGALTDQQPIREYIAAESKRFSISRSYFSSWADQKWRAITVRQALHQVQESKPH